MRKAFTLAEVLITLGIIGVVAALVMPSLIAKHNEKETIVKLKKVYSTLSNAMLLAVSENGTPQDWSGKAYTYLDPDITRALIEGLLPYLNVSKYCGLEACGKKYNITMLNGNAWGNLTSNSNFSKVYLSDGTLINAFAQGPYGVYVLDVNGSKPPNVMGKDVFRFQVTADGVVTPVGLNSDTGCLGANPNGYNCAAWVVVNENMDYLHCPDQLSWNGKTKCN